MLRQKQAVFYNYIPKGVHKSMPYYEMGQIKLGLEIATGHCFSNPKNY